MESGESISVITPLPDWDERIYPTMFFTYFSDAPVYDTATQSFNTLNLGDFIIRDEDEEEEAEKDFPTTWVSAKAERTRVVGRNEEREEWETQKELIDY